MPAIKPACKRDSPEEALKYELFAVRPDTSGSLRDVGIEPLGDPRLDCGVTPRLVFALRQALDSAYLRWDLSPEWVEPARKWCQKVRIVVTGGFNPTKDRAFRAPPGAGRRVWRWLVADRVVFRLRHQHRL